MSEDNDIACFFNPKSIAVIGASATPGKVGYNVLKNIIDSGYTGKIYPINPKAKEVNGLKVYKSVIDVPEDIEIAIFVIPGKLIKSVYSILYSSIFNKKGYL